MVTPGKKMKFVLTALQIFRKDWKKCLVCERAVIANMSSFITMMLRKVVFFHVMTFTKVNTDFMAGGEPGSPGLSLLLKSDGRTINLGGKAAVRMKPGVSTTKPCIGRQHLGIDDIAN